MTVTVNLEDILISKKNPVVAMEPFPHFKLDNFFPEPIYEALAAEFPDRDGFHRRLFLEQKYFTTKDETNALLADKPTWRQLISLMVSQPFLDDYRSVMDQGLRKVRRFFGRGRWLLDPTEGKEAVGITSNRVVPHYQFSRLEAGSYVVPHTDKLEKLSGLLFYFPTADWQPEWGGATEVLQAKDPKKNVNWTNRHLDYEDLVKLGDSGFRRNTAFSFLRSVNSWHAVSRIQCPPGYGRNTFNFFCVQQALSKPTLSARAVHAYHRRTEAWRFADVPDAKTIEHDMLAREINNLLQTGMGEAEVADALYITVDQVRKFRK